MAHEYRVFAQFDARDINTGSIGLLSESDRHHLLKVLRLREGDAIVAVARNEAREFDSKIILHNDQIAVQVQRMRTDTAPLSRIVSLSCALLKGSNNDLICEHAAELGVRNICFFSAQKSVAKAKANDDIQKRLSRWSKIAESAARQSGQVAIPNIYFGSSLAELISHTKLIAGNGDRYFCCALIPGAQEIRKISAPQAGIHLAVGPEGDFTEAEYNSLIQCGFEGISLGPLRLRAETAAITAVAMAQAVWGF